MSSYPFRSLPICECEGCLTARALDRAREEMLAKVRAAKPACEVEMRREVASAMAGGTADGPTQRGWDPTEFEG